MVSLKGAVMVLEVDAVMVSQKNQASCKNKTKSTMENPGNDIGPSGSIAFGCFFYALGA